MGDTACVASKILCRSRRTLSSWARQSAAAQSSRSSSGPFTLAVLPAPWADGLVIASNLSFGSGAFDSKPQWLTWSTSAPFRARHVPVSGQLCEAAAEGSSLVPRFPVAFRPTGIRLSDHPFPPLVGVGPPLRSAYRATPGPRRGFHVPHGPRPDRRGCPLYPGATVLPRPAGDHRPPLPLSSGRPCPQRCVPSPGATITRHQRRYRLRSPVRPSPCLWPRMGRAPLGFSPDASNPAVAGDGSRTLLRSSPSSTCPILQSVSPLVPCDLVSHSPLGSLHVVRALLPGVLAS